MRIHQQLISSLGSRFHSTLKYVFLLCLIYIFYLIYNSLEWTRCFDIKLPNQPSRLSTIEFFSSFFSFFLYVWNFFLLFVEEFPWTGRKCRSKANIGGFRKAAVVTTPKTLTLGLQTAGIQPTCFDLFITTVSMFVVQNQVRQYC